jgi:hypothetical protein
VNQILQKHIESIKLSEKIQSLKDDASLTNVQKNFIISVKEEILEECEQSIFKFLTEMKLKLKLRDVNEKQLRTFIVDY